MKAIYIWLLVVIACFLGVAFIYSLSVGFPQNIVFLSRLGFNDSGFIYFWPVIITLVLLVVRSPKFFNADDLKIPRLVDPLVVSLISGWILFLFFETGAISFATILLVMLGIYLVVLIAARNYFKVVDSLTLLIGLIFSFSFIPVVFLLSQ